MRIDNRLNNQLRPVKITPGYVDYPEGSVLIDASKTRALAAPPLLLQRMVAAGYLGTSAAKCFTITERNSQ